MPAQKADPRTVKNMVGSIRLTNGEAALLAKAYGTHQKAVAALVRAELDRLRKGTS